MCVYTYIFPTQIEANTFGDLKKMKSSAGNENGNAMNLMKMTGFLNAIGV